MSEQPKKQIIIGIRDFTDCPYNSYIGSYARNRGERKPVCGHPDSTTLKGTPRIIPYRKQKIRDRIELYAGMPTRIPHWCPLDDVPRRDEGAPGRQRLFDHMATEHDLYLTQGQMMDIERIVLEEEDVICCSVCKNPLRASNPGYVIDGEYYCHEHGNDAFKMNDDT